jgi:hypothetical protein
MGKKVMLALTSLVLTLSVLMFSSPPKKAEASSLGGTCYPAYECMDSGALPTSYTLYYSNPDRRLGSLLGAAGVGAISLIPGVNSAAAVALWASGVALGARDTYYGSNSYRVYVKKSPYYPYYTVRVKTIYYSGYFYFGSTKTVVEDK